MLRFTTLLVLLVLCFTGTACAQPDAASTAADRYQTGVATRDGIGKFYMGREIAQVMGYQGAAWLERPDREAEEATDGLVRELPLTESSVVADIGAGTGYFSFRIAQRVPEGRVLAVDIQQEMLEIIDRRQAELGVTNVETVRGSEQNPNLPEGVVDLVLLVDVYHEFSYPYEMMRAIGQALKPGGLVALVDYRPGDPAVPFKPLHTLCVEQARAELEAAGLIWEATHSGLPQQNLILFNKPAD
jgi:SAM-dependent methyltransferase